VVLHLIPLRRIVKSGKILGNSAEALPVASASRLILNGAEIFVAKMLKPFDKSTPGGIS
jgi:hypothetical protein